MEPYRVYGRFYDPTQGAPLASRYRRLLRTHHPRARTLLEIACGTGANLLPLSRHYAVTGVDISRTMLRLARAKLPGVPLYRQDMTRLRLDRRFDAVICPYDSINHLRRFRDWASTFRAVRRHLDDRGLFIFDMNTRFKLGELVTAPASVQRFGDHYLLLTVTAGRRGVAHWDLRVFERTRGSRYRLHRERIAEVSFPLARVRSALRREFASVRALDMRSLSRPGRTSRRIVFLCRPSPGATRTR